MANVRGMMGYLWKRQIKLAEFKKFAGDLTAQIRQAAEEQAFAQQRRFRLRLCAPKRGSFSIASASSPADNNQTISPTVSHIRRTIGKE